MISEKEMEDQIAAHPERFLGERHLSLVSRQVRIGSYRFDLLFEDRHGGKLIVEIQRGTLDREHTYKILDYYDEYRERNPGEFIDVMVVANIIPVERKKRLQALGVEFRELAEALFTTEARSTMEIQQIADHPTREASDEERVSESSVEAGHVPFQSLGKSAFIAAVRVAIHAAIECGASERWKIGGDSSLCIVSVPTTAAIDCVSGRGLKAQIWMERPAHERATCKFEVAYKVET